MLIDVSFSYPYHSPTVPVNATLAMPPKVWVAKVTDAQVLPVYMISQFRLPLHESTPQYSHELPSA